MSNWLTLFFFVLLLIFWEVILSPKRTSSKNLIRIRTIRYSKTSKLSSSNWVNLSARTSMKIILTKKRLVLSLLFPPSITMTTMMLLRNTPSERMSSSLTRLTNIYTTSSASPLIVELSNFYNFFAKITTNRERTSLEFNLVKLDSSISSILQLKNLEISSKSSVMISRKFLCSF